MVFTSRSEGCLAARLGSDIRVLPGSKASHLFKNSCSDCGKNQSCVFQSSGALKTAMLSFVNICEIRNTNSLQKPILMLLTSPSRSKMFKCYFKIHEDTSEKGSPQVLCISRAVGVRLTGSVPRLMEGAYTEAYVLFRMWSAVRAVWKEEKNPSP